MFKSLYITSMFEIEHILLSNPYKMNDVFKQFNYADLLFRDILKSFYDIVYMDEQDHEKINHFAQYINCKIKTVKMYKDDSLQIYDGTFACYFAEQEEYLLSLRKRLGFYKSKPLLLKILLKDKTNAK